MIKAFLRPICIMVVFAGMLSGFSALADPAEDESDNNGEDITRPINRFDVRLQLKTLPDASQSDQTFDDRHAETVTLRTDWVLLSKPDQISLRFDLPIVFSNKPTSQNQTGATQSGLGDVLTQVAWVHTFDSRWALATGLQTIVPTATEAAFGNGKLQLAPGIAVRGSLPEISNGSYTGLFVRQFVSVAGDGSRQDISYLELQPQFNLSLPDKWFLNTSPKIRFNFYTDKWFVPLDLMVGKKFGIHWIASVEYQYGLVRGYPQYNQWIEARIGYFF